MISADNNTILAHQLRKLAQSGLPAQEMAARIQQLLERDRAEKASESEPKADFLVPLFGRKAHLSLV